MPRFFLLVVIPPHKRVKQATPSKNFHRIEIPQSLLRTFFSRVKQGIHQPQPQPQPRLQLPSPSISIFPAPSSNVSAAKSARPLSLSLSHLHRDRRPPSTVRLKDGGLNPPRKQHNALDAPPLGRNPQNARPWRPHQAAICRQSNKAPSGFPEIDLRSSHPKHLVDL